VFYDRLINEEDRQWFQKLVMELMGQVFNSRMEKEDIFGETGIRFGDLLRLDLGRDYEEIKDQTKLLKVLDEKQDDYLEGKSLTKLIFFNEAIDHVLKIARVLR
jgi:dynein heavy chain, axonemal